MSKRVWAGLLAGAALSLANGAAVAQELTIFWAEWDPANYLQELVNEYETPRPASRSRWRPRRGPTSRPRPSPSSTPRATPTTWSSATRQWLGAGSTGGHYVDLTDFFNKHKLAELMAPATVKYYAEYPGQRQVLGDPARGRRHRLGLPQGLVRGPEGEGGLQGQVRLRSRRAEGPATQLRDIAEFFYRPDEKRYGIAIYTDNSYDALAMGVENALFSYGGDLGDYATYKVDGIINSRQGGRGARGLPATSTSSRRRAGARPSSWRTTRRSPRAWRR